MSRRCRDFSWLGYAHKLPKPAPSLQGVLGSPPNETSESSLGLQTQQPTTPSGIPGLIDSGVEYTVTLASGATKDNEIQNSKSIPISSIYTISHHIRCVNLSIGHSSSQVVTYEDNYFGERFANARRLLALPTSPQSSIEVIRRSTMWCPE